MDVDSDLQRFGENFAREYYTTLSERPRDLARYYGEHAIFVHGASSAEIRTAIGRKDVRDCVVRLDRDGCTADLRSVNTRRVLDYVVISVTGELATKYGRKKFTQTIVLGDLGNECEIKNDMFFYNDEVATRQDEDGRDGDDGWAGRKLRDCVVDHEPPTCRHQSSAADSYYYPPVSHQIFVSGIPGNVQPQVLRRFFERYGKLHSLRVMKKNVNYGFVTFLDAESARTVLQNRPILFTGDDDDGVWLVVKKKKTAYRDRKNVMHLPACHQLFVGDVPNRVTSDGLKRFFEKWGEVVNAQIVVVREKVKSEETMHGFVTFATEHGAKMILENRPIVFPHENGRAELTIMEKFRRPFRNSRHFVHEKLRKRERK